MAKRRSVGGARKVRKGARVHKTKKRLEAKRLMLIAKAAGRRKSKKR
jgi:hypothetical protein